MVSPFESRRSKRALDAYVRGAATDRWLAPSRLTAKPDYKNIGEIVSVIGGHGTELVLASDGREEGAHTGAPLHSPPAQVQAQW